MANAIQDERQLQKQAREESKEDHLTQLAIDEALRQLLDRPEGRKLLWWLLEIAGVFNNPYTGDANATYFLCGQMNIGQQVLTRIGDVSTNGMVSMMQEKADDDRRRKDRDGRNDNGREDGSGDADDL